MESVSGKGQWGDGAVRGRSRSEGKENVTERWNLGGWCFNRSERAERRSEAVQTSPGQSWRRVEVFQISPE